MVSINTNNGTECQNESLKYQYLKDRNNNSLSGMITKLAEEFLPDKYRRYRSVKDQQCNTNIYHFEEGSHFIRTSKKWQNCQVWGPWHKNWVFSFLESQANPLNLPKSSNCCKESLSNVRPLKLGQFVIFDMFSVFQESFSFFYYWQGHSTLVCRASLFQAVEKAGDQ